MLRIYQYRVHSIFKCDPDLYIADGLFQNIHTEKSDQEITGMITNMNAISTLVNMPVYTSIEDIQVATPGMPSCKSYMH